METSDRGKIKTIARPIHPSSQGFIESLSMRRILEADGQLLSEVFGANIIAPPVSLTPQQKENLVLNSRQKLQNLFNQPKTRPFVIALYNESARAIVPKLPEVEYLYSPNVSSAALHDMNTFFIPTEDQKKLVRVLFDKDVISDDIYTQVLRDHEQRFHTKREQLRERLPKLIENFLSNLPTMTGYSEELRETARQRLETISYDVIDGLIAIPEDKWGEYDVQRRTIRIAEQIPDAVFVHVIGHEVLHGVSGQTVIQRTTSLPQDDDSMFIEDHTVDYYALRTGVRAGKHFRWLNEAITETLACEVDATSPMPVLYLPHKKLLQLLTRHVPFEQFVKAYFEDYDTGVQSHERIPHWKALYKAINTAYRPGFLSELDVFIKENGNEGVKKAVEFLKMENSRMDIMNLSGRSQSERS